MIIEERYEFEVKRPIGTKTGSRSLAIVKGFGNWHASVWLWPTYQKTKMKPDISAITTTSPNT
jgi:hypothetical protein